MEVLTGCIGGGVEWIEEAPRDPQNLSQLRKKGSLYRMTKEVVEGVKLLVIHRELQQLVPDQQHVDLGPIHQYASEGSAMLDMICRCGRDGAPPVASGTCRTIREASKHFMFVLSPTFQQWVISTRERHPDEEIVRDAAWCQNHLRRAVREIHLMVRFRGDEGDTFVPDRQVVARTRADSGGPGGETDPTTAEGIITRAYTNPAMGFRGRDKLFTKLSHMYWGITRDVVNSVLSKIPGKQRTEKPPRTIAKPIRPYGTGHHQVDCTFMRNYNRKRSRRDAIGLVVVVDRFSRFVWTQHFGGSGPPTGEAMAMILSEMWMVEGAPVILQSDGGGEFNNAVMAEMCTRFGVQQVFSKSHHPQSNGAVERVNQTLKRSLYRLMSYYQKQRWWTFLKYVTYAYNNSVHRTTGQTPFALHRGFQPPMLGMEQSFGNYVPRARHTTYDAVRQAAEVGESQEEGPTRDADEEEALDDASLRDKIQRSIAGTPFHDNARVLSAIASIQNVATDYRRRLSGEQSIQDDYAEASVAEDAHSQVEVDFIDIEIAKKGDDEIRILGVVDVDEEEEEEELASRGQHVLDMDTGSLEWIQSSGIWGVGYGIGPRHVRSGDRGMVCFVRGGMMESMKRSSGNPEVRRLYEEKVIDPVEAIPLNLRILLSTKWWHGWWHVMDDRSVSRQLEEVFAADMALLVRDLASYRKRFMDLQKKVTDAKTPETTRKQEQAMKTFLLRTKQKTSTTGAGCEVLGMWVAEEDDRKILGLNIQYINQHSADSRSLEKIYEDSKDLCGQISMLIIAFLRVVPGMGPPGIRVGDGELGWSWLSTKAVDLAKSVCDIHAKVQLTVSDMWDSYSSMGSFVHIDSWADGTVSFCGVFVESCRNHPACVYSMPYAMRRRIRLPASSSREVTEFEMIPVETCVDDLWEEWVRFLDTVGGYIDPSTWAMSPTPPGDIQYSTEEQIVGFYVSELPIPVRSIRTPTDDKPWEFSQSHVSVRVNGSVDMRTVASHGYITFNATKGELVYGADISRIDPVYLRVFWQSVSGWRVH